MQPDFSAFLFPGQNSPSSAPRPFLQSLEMMAKIWQNLTKAAPEATALTMNPEELNKRIEQLKTVESWLQLNLSMLSSTIQGLEIQRASINNLSAFMEIMSKSHSPAAEAGKQAVKTPIAAPVAETSIAETEVAETPSTNAPTTQRTASTNQSEKSYLSKDALAWFDMLKTQIEQIAQTTGKNISQLNKHSPSAQHATLADQEPSVRTTPSSATTVKAKLSPSAVSRAKSNPDDKPKASAKLASNKKKTTTVLSSTRKQASTGKTSTKRSTAKTSK